MRFTIMQHFVQMCMVLTCVAQMTTDYNRCHVSCCFWYALLGHPRRTEAFVASALRMYTPVVNGPTRGNGTARCILALQRACGAAEQIASGVVAAPQDASHVRP